MRVADQVRVGVELEGARLNVYVWLRNVGPGIALIKPDACTITGKAKGTNESLQRIGHVDQPALPLGEVAIIGFRIEGPGVAFDSFTRRDSSQWGEFWVSVPYTDANGGQEVRADIHIAGDKEGVEAHGHDRLCAPACRATARPGTVRHGAPEHRLSPNGCQDADAVVG